MRALGYLHRYSKLLRAVPPDFWILRSALQDPPGNEPLLACQIANPAIVPDIRAKKPREPHRWGHE
jgi:hypothetical protein